MPGRAIAGWDHVGMTGKANEWRCVPPPRPEIAHLAKRQPFRAKAQRFETCGNKRLATRVVGRDRGPPNKRLQQVEFMAHDRRRIRFHHCHS